MATTDARYELGILHSEQLPPTQEVLLLLLRWRANRSRHRILIDPDPARVVGFGFAAIALRLYTGSACVLAGVEKALTT